MGLFGFLKKAAPERPPADAPPVPRAVFYRGAKAVLVFDKVCKVQEAIQHPIISRCLRIICRSVQVVDWRAEAISGSQAVSKKVIQDLNDLLASPNDDMTAPDLRYWLAFSLATYGKANLKVGSPGTRVASGLYPLDAKFTKTELGSSGRVSQYVYGPSDRSTTFPSYSEVSRGGALPSTSFGYQIRSPSLSADPTSDGDLLTPLNGLGGPARVIEALLQRTLSTAQGHPNAKYIVSSEDELTDDQLDELDEYIESHEAFGERSGEIMFLRGAKVQVHRLDADMSDIHSKVPMDDMTRMIFGAFGIPVALAGLGAADAAKFTSNLAESRSMFYNDTLIPEYLSPIASGLTRVLCPPGVRIMFDMASLPALLPARIQMGAQLESISYLTAEEKREMLGFSPAPSSGALPAPPSETNT